MKTETPAQRAYAVRLALGDGWKVPMPMTVFASLLAKQKGSTRYDSSIISRIESGDRKLTLEDAVAYAAVDPQRRGRAWIAWGENDKPADQGGLDDIEAGAVMLTPAQIARAEEQAAATRAAKRQAATSDTHARPLRKKGR